MIGRWIWGGREAEEQTKDEEEVELEDVVGEGNKKEDRKKERRKLLIVSLDGGGVRGALQCKILGRLFERFYWLEDRVDMYAGSSAGAFLASALSFGSFSEARHLCTTKTFSSIFYRSWEQEISSLDGWKHSKYSSDALSYLLQNFFGDDKKVGEARRHLLVTAFRVGATEKKEEEQLDSLCSAFFLPNRWQPVIYHNLDSNNTAQLTKPIKDALLETSAAPTIFAAQNKCVDGGLVANNPCMLAVSQALRFGLVESLDEIYLLSIGTGKSPQHLSENDFNTGAARWMSLITDVLMQANAECAVLECASILGTKNFCRIQPVLDKNVALDDYTCVPYLEEIGSGYDLKEAIEFLQIFEN